MKKGHCEHTLKTVFDKHLLKPDKHQNTVHPRFSGPRLTGPSINRPGSTGRYIELFSLKSTRFKVEKKHKANKQCC